MAGFPRYACSSGGVHFRRAFLSRRRLPDWTYERALFFECASLHTLVLALLLDNPAASTFAVERQLIERVATATTMAEVQAALCSYRRRATVRHGWLRVVAGIGISPRRLARLARECLPDTASEPVSYRRAA